MITWTIIKTFFSNLNIKLTLAAIAAVVLLGLGAYTFYEHHQVQTLKPQIQQQSQVIQQQQKNIFVVQKDVQIQSNFDDQKQQVTDKVQKIDECQAQVKDT